MRTDFTIPKNFLSYVKCEILNVYKSNLLYTAVFMHKNKKQNYPSSFLQKFEQPCLLIRIQHTFHLEITGNHKLNYKNVHFEFPLEVQQYGTT